MHRQGSSPLCSAELTLLFNLFVLTNHSLFQSALYLPAQPSAHFTKALLSGSVAMAVDRHSADPGKAHLCTCLSFWAWEVEKVQGCCVCV